MTGSEPVVIDLGAAEPWAPPDTLRPRRRASAGTRLAALLLVATLAAGLPVADAAVSGPLLHIGAGVSDATLGDGRLFVTRSLGAGGHRLDAYDAAGGAVLWSTELDDGQQLAFADAGVVVLSEYSANDPALATVTVRDARTGAELWRRGGARVVGMVGGRILTSDLSKAEPEQGAERVPPESRVLAVDARTGAVAWTLVVPAGSNSSYGRDPRNPYGVSSLAVMDPDGTLRVYDPADGAVERTYRIERSSSSAHFVLGDDDGLSAPGARAGQVAVGFRDLHPAHRDRQASEDVYDLATGRLLWHLDVSEPSAVLTGCAPGRWCTTDSHGLAAYDPATGEQVWRVEAYDLIFGDAGGDLVLGRLGEEGRPLPDLLVVDGRTGTPRHRLDGWRAIRAPGGRGVVWRRDEGQRATVVGLLDPASGRIAVFGRGDSWAGEPRCVTGGGFVACGVVGDLTVWRLPVTAGG
ncbi:PQQ-binding-like beta-propeller repeat protein [Dactylosporangium sp. NPDC051484]|uniref:outer membrane protein assembly factor BamB family protein n=1 Tax=Dactylosporangium sp. NPDC051484 TaxID=3154942 RepID=UPI00344C4358